ncbi:hypothetical protein V2S66_28505 [Streptomyces sp. V4-01]|uniref:Thiazolylpeptide-type bacteriocin n=1 Tax=Actinacidiphila polyblastidii TaxID=3110430 RepID=A0ABU7PKX9_9ACTN|nr:hypothetical protein [Streptomyces sp. V4-01]
MPQMTDEYQGAAVEEEFDFSDLDLSTLSVTSTQGPTSKTDFGVVDSWPPSCCCAPN